jgi:hypothetical protein
MNHYAWVVLAAAWLGLTFFPSLLYRTLGGGALLRRPSRERTLQENCQPCCSMDRKDVRPRFFSVRDVPDNLAMDGAGDTVLQLEVHLGNGVFWEYRCVRDITWNPSAGYSSEFEQSRGHKRIAADSTILRIVNLFIALSLGVHREQLEHLIGLTWPRPFLLRPL